jgi:DNA helicase-2/ATP-dependent DNA helicase PcrA
MAEAADPLAALCRVPCPPRAGDDWNAFVETVGNLRYSEWPADLERACLWYEPHLDRIHEDAEVRRAFSPSLRWTLRMRRATRPACLCSTRTT